MNHGSLLILIVTGVGHNEGLWISTVRREVGVYFERFSFFGIMCNKWIDVAKQSFLAAGTRNQEACHLQQSHVHC